MKVSQLAKIKALIVEDDPMVVDISKEFIKEAPDFQVVGVAKNGAEAVALTRELEPEIILLDNCLPDFKEYKVIEKFAVFIKVDFIMITQKGVLCPSVLYSVSEITYQTFFKATFAQALNNYKCFLNTINQAEVSQAVGPIGLPGSKCGENFQKALAN